MVVNKDRLFNIVIHLLVWILLTFVLFMYPTLAGVKYLPEDFWIKQVVHILVMLVAFYTNAYYFVPKFLITNKLKAFFLLSVALILCSSMFLAKVDSLLDLTSQMERSGGRRMWPNPHIDFFGLMTTLITLGISTSVALAQQWRSDAELRQELEKNQSETELAFLKTQIHPHFFFNTLNSIYALTFTNVDASREVLHKLSRMMRYLLYETQQQQTKLSREISFVEDYIEIMRTRLGENTTVLFQYDDKMTDRSFTPMLLLPFIENAFKHGVDDEQTTTIDILITQHSNRLELKVTNTLVSNTSRQTNDYTGKGIGLANTKRRLDLLYKDRYHLDTQVDHVLNKYKVILQLKLDEAELHSH